MRGAVFAVVVCLAAQAGCGGSRGPASDLSHGLQVEVPRSTGRPPAVLTAADWGHERAVATDRPVYTDPGEIPRLQLAGEERTPLPLEHTHVSARLTGFVAEVEVRQSYGNPFSEPIEAVYVFPLPENSAVDHMRMEIGERVIEAEIQRREEARRTYETARREGYTAALLEQERPNVFTQSVANIAPGERVDVVVRYVQDLTYDAGEYEFVFPMVVGPRFVPGRELPGPQAGEGTRADTDEVPDASRITPPVLGRGQRSGHDISIEVLADASLAVGELQVPTHEVEVSRPADGSVRLALAERDSLPNRDFVLRYRVAEDQPRATLFLSGGEQEGFFSLAIYPPSLDVDRLVGQREMIFVVDVSGSMSGAPLALCRVAMREALGRLRPVDTFDIITFSGGTGSPFGRPVPANDANLRTGLEYVDRMMAGGGTYMDTAVEAALSPEVEQGRHRYVFFMTDGYVGDDDVIIASTDRFVSALERRGQRARVFGFGVGSSVNRHLLDGIGRAGRGITVYASSREHPARAVNQFFRYVDRSVLQDLRVDWADLGATDVQPEVLPDLFASHALVLHGRYSRPPSRELAVRGRAGDREVRLPVTVRSAAVAGDPAEVLGSLWARSRVRTLEEDLRQGMDVSEEITRLGLDHHIVTQFTSFVAVDRSRRVGQGDPARIVQPVEVPEGVDGEMAGAVSDDALGLQAAGEPAPAVGQAVSLEAREELESAEPEDQSDDRGRVSVTHAGAPAPARYRHGCHCRASAAEGLGSLPLSLLVLLSLLALRRGR